MRLRRYQLGQKEEGMQQSRCTGHPHDTTSSVFLPLSVLSLHITETSGHSTLFSWDTVTMHGKGIHEKTAWLSKKKKKSAPKHVLIPFSHTLSKVSLYLISSTRKTEKPSTIHFIKVTIESIWLLLTWFQMVSFLTSHVARIVSLVTILSIFLLF